MKKIKIGLLIVVAGLMVISMGGSVNAGSNPEGKPFKKLQKQIDKLKRQVANIEQIPGPPGPPGPPGEGGKSINVYDADGQYLGIFLGNDSYHSNIFIPGVNKEISIGQVRGPVMYLDFSWVLYASNDCSGQAYTEPGESTTTLNKIFRGRGVYNPGGGILQYIENFPFPLLIISPEIKENLEILSVNHFIDENNTECINVPEEDPYVAHYAFEIIQIPVEDIPFSLPAATPLQVIYE